MKAQMSLEMIVGMIILLIVAGVIITLFMRFISPEQFPRVDPIEQKKAEIARICGPLCGDYQSGRSTMAGIEYCKRQFSEDMTGDGKKLDAFQTAKFLFVCEDSFYCPHVHECQLATGIIDLNYCKRLLCSSLRDKYLSVGKSAEEARELASAEILGIIKRGTCTFPEDEVDWFYEIYEKTEPVCS